MTTRTNLFFIATIFVFTLAFAATRASAQVDCSPAVAHAHLACEVGDVSVDPSTLTCGSPTVNTVCQCDTGYHPQDADDPVSTDNTCVANAPTPQFCIFPDGTTVTGARCCPAGGTPLRVSREASADRLASFHIPRGHSVYVCGNALAAPGAPGSRDERFDALASRVSDLEAGWRALCAPDEGESMEAACTDARTEFLAAGSGAGATDLSGVEAAIAELRNDFESYRDIADTHMLGLGDSIMQLAETQGILLRCLSSGEPNLMVSWTGPGPDGNDITTELPCAEILAATSEEAVEQARAEAARIAREEVGRIGGTARGDHAFFGASAFAFVNFNPLVHANTNYGNLGVVGLELTFGTTFSGTWNWQIGLDVGYGFPDLAGATNLEGMLRLGLGTWVDPRFQIGFGLIGAVRFQPDITAVHAIYGAYLDGTYRFSATDTVTPFLTLRVMAGASPRQPADVWRIDGDGAAMFLFGVLIN